MKLITNLLLAIVALLLGVIFIPLGILFTIIKLLVKLRGKEVYQHLCDLFFSIAISLDQLGNTCCKYLFNACLIKDDSLEFGSVDETISSVLGRNKQTNNLTFVGRKLDSLLCLFEEDHSIKSIGS